MPVQPTIKANLATLARSQNFATLLAALNGAAWVLGPVVGVALYGWHESVFFTLAIVICAAMVAHGARRLQRGLGKSGSGDQQA